MVEIVNVVAGGSLNREIDLNHLREELGHSEVVATEFAENAPWQLLIRLTEQPGMMILYRTGKYILRGGHSFDTLTEARDIFTNLFIEYEVIISKNDLSYCLQNIVFLEIFQTTTDLNKAVLELGLNHTEYEPEQFPRIIYRSEECEAVAIIFTTGKAIVTGTVDQNEAVNIANVLRDRLIN